jgi:hypothetical protein
MMVRQPLEAVGGDQVIALEAHTADAFLCRGQAPA